MIKRRYKYFLIIWKNYSECLKNRVYKISLIICIIEIDVGYNLEEKFSQAGTKRKLKLQKLNKIIIILPNLSLSQS
ncbi:helicase carboxy-terminal domain protein, putative (macronuclear) [Tetrahymena thermophila SB210]|uniref:Helicase carboxy-terminal domain protein, putative n=1 Tax=Tetrahymena thermophila (strain SB210) TaxID=312017 RepID=Q23FJ7_TETTS|nr:helicase carboxy-terminal domain protein, putative [Tetrahymena thermophila SB210]EAR95156.2 helicase carboxy-terminal domain protein, putative [Tetrahymena thermophila SB210]|eukprot:XP_001015401.2 helicase carboxy-terminal domain protein, putative [Tetrahymena thermophila SB210]